MGESDMPRRPSAVAHRNRNSAGALEPVRRRDHEGPFRIKNVKPRDVPPSAESGPPRKLGPSPAPGTSQSPGGSQAPARSRGVLPDPSPEPGPSIGDRFSRAARYHSILLGRGTHRVRRSLKRIRTPESVRRIGPLGQKSLVARLRRRRSGQFGQKTLEAARLSATGRPLDEDRRRDRAQTASPHLSAGL